jgi:hypothetical protein
LQITGSNEVIDLLNQDYEKKSVKVSFAKTGTVHSQIKIIKDAATIN